MNTMVSISNYQHTVQTYTEMFNVYHSLGVVTSTEIPTVQLGLAKQTD